MVYYLYMNTWNTIENKLTKTWKFETFIQALEFVNAVAAIAEDMQHHPDITLHDYNAVTISTWTHSEHTITQKDHILATNIDSI